MPEDIKVDLSLQEVHAVLCEGCKEKVKGLIKSHIKEQIKDNAVEDMATRVLEGETSKKGG